MAHAIHPNLPGAQRPDAGTAHPGSHAASLLANALAHSQGQLLNAALLAQANGISGQTVARYMVVYPGAEIFNLDHGTQAMPLAKFLEELPGF